jgi:phosphatidylglycerophosphate synthase
MKKPFEVLYNLMERAMQWFLGKVLPTNPQSKWARRIPNFISLSRIPLGLAVAGMVKGHWPILPIIGVFILGALTDLADGTAARMMNCANMRSGKILDPLCDKVFIALCVADIYQQIWPFTFYGLAASEALFFLLGITAIVKPVKDPSTVIFGKVRFTLECLGVLAIIRSLPLLGNVSLTLALIPMVPLTLAYGAVKQFSSRKD